MPTATITTARETLTENVLPAVRTGLTTAREKGGELLASDKATEAKRRGYAMLKAARGEPVVTVKPARRFGKLVGLLGLGAIAGVGLTWLARRMSTPVETYRTGPLPVPSGTDGGAVPQPAANSTTLTEDIDLRAGSPTLP